MEFRRDVVTVARKREATLTQIAKDFGISEACLHRWLKLADIEDGVRPGVTTDEAIEVRETPQAQSGARAGERDPSPGGCVLCSRVAPKVMYPLVQELAVDGLPVTLTLNQLRHTLATQAINCGMRLEGIATMLGHRSLRITLTYARIANKTVADEYATASAKIDALYIATDPEQRLQQLAGEHRRMQSGALQAWGGRRRSMPVAPRTAAVAAIGVPTRMGADIRLSRVRFTRAAHQGGELRDETSSILDQRHARRLLPSRGRAPPGRGVDALLDR